MNLCLLIITFFNKWLKFRNNPISQRGTRPISKPLDCGASHSCSDNKRHIRHQVTLQLFSPQKHQDLILADSLGKASMFSSLQERTIIIYCAASLDCGPLRMKENLQSEAQSSLSGFPSRSWLADVSPDSWAWKQHWSTFMTWRSRRLEWGLKLSAAESF